MAYSYNFTENSNNIASTGNPSGKVGNTSWGRVRTVILDESHPSYVDDSSIGSIEYSNLLTPGVVSIAYPYEASLRSTPLPGEIVELIVAPDQNLDVIYSSATTYYRGGVNIWNQVNNNNYPDRISSQFTDDLIDQPEVKTLYPYKGDITLQGRNGQSIRMGGYTSPNNRISTPDNFGNPFILIRNRQKRDSQDSNFTTEDINLDGSSLYMISDQKVNLKQATKKKSTYLTPPDEFDNYKGDQLILNSDRIVLNSRKEHILLSGKKSIGLAGKTVNIDGQDYIGLDANFIYLGQEPIKSEQKQPAVLGLETKKLLQDVVDILATVSSQLALMPSSPAVAVATLKGLGATIGAYIPELQIQLEKINSKKVFIDSGVNNFAPHSNSGV
jgi:hypothetical protein